MSGNFKKRGLAIHWYFLLIAFFGGLLTYFYFSAKSEVPSLEFVGQSSVMILTAMQRGFNVLHYLDKSAGYALEQSIYDLAKKGGTTQSDCGRYFGSTVWADISKENNAVTVRECYPTPEQLAGNLAVFLDSELSDYALAYPQAYLPMDYEYEISGAPSLVVNAIAQQDIDIPILPEDFSSEIRASDTDVGFMEVPHEVYLNTGGKTFENEKKYSPLIYKYAREHDVNYYFAKSIIQIETRFMPATSFAGAQGLMQVMPATARGIGCPLKWGEKWKTDIEPNIDCGVTYLKHLIDEQKKRNIPPTLQNTAAAYNCGPKAWSNIEQCITRNKKTGKIVDTTKDYVARMMKNYAALVQKSGRAQTQNQISGAATKEKNKDNPAAQGSYYLNPSLTLARDYAFFLEYDGAIQRAKKIVSDCTQENNIEKCLTEKISTQKMGCTPDDYHEIFYNVLDPLFDCPTSDKEVAVCRLSLKNINLKDAALQTTYLLQLSAQGEVTGALLGKAKNNADPLQSPSVFDYVPVPISYVTYETRALPRELESVQIYFEIKNKMPVITLINAKTKDGTDIALSKFLLYKYQDTLSFITSESEPKFLEDVGKKNVALINVPQKKAVSLCLPSSYEVSVYDVSDKKIAARPLIYTFAITYPAIQTPPPVEKIHVEDKQKAEGTLLISWEPPIQNPPIKKYNIYCRELEFDAAADGGELNLNGVLPVAEITYAPTDASLKDVYPDVWDADISTCLSKQNKIEKIIDGKTYYVTVVGVGEQQSVGSAKIYYEGISKDDLAAGPVEITLSDNQNTKLSAQSASNCIVLPNSNGGVQGTVFVDVRPPEIYEEGTTIARPDPIQYTYYLHYAKNTPQLKNLDTCTQNRCVQTKNRRVSFDRSTSIDVPADNNLFKEGERYCFTVVALDEQKNSISEMSIVSGRAVYEFETPKQWETLKNFKIKNG